MSKITIEELSDSLKTYLQNQASDLAHEAENRAIQQAELRLDEQFDKTENTSYETVNGYKEFTCKDGYVDNIYIEGKTLVNVIPKNANYVGNGWGSGQGIVDRGSNNDYIKIQHTSGGNEYVAYPDANPMVKAGVEYTLIVDVMEMTSHGLYEIFYIAAEAQHLFAGNTVQRIVLKFTPKHDGGYIRFDADLLATVKFSNPILLEGDYTAIADSLPYFEGMKSIGQGDNIEFLTLADNLLDKSDFVVGSTISVVGDKFEIDNRTNRITHRTPIPTDVYEYLAFPYAESFKACVYELDENDIILAAYTWNQSVFIRSITPGTKYIRVIFAYNDNREMTMADYDKIMPYLTNKYNKQILKTTLRSLPNGVHDEIIKNGGKYYKIERCGEVTFNGYEEWTTISNASLINNIRLKTNVSNLAFKDTEITCTSDKFMGLTNKEWNADKEHIDQDGSALNIVISRTKATDPASFKTWLQSNPVTVVYELLSPKIIELPNFNPLTYEGDTTLFINNKAPIRGECSFEVTNSITNEIELLKEKVSGLYDEHRNISIGYYSLTLMNGVYKTGNNIARIMVSGDNAVVTAELKTDANIPSSTFIAKIPVPLADAYHPITISLLTPSGNTFIEGWLYRDGMIRTFGLIPAGSTIFFTIPVLIKR